MTDAKKQYPAEVQVPRPRPFKNIDPPFADKWVVSYWPPRIPVRGYDLPHQEFFSTKEEAYEWANKKAEEYGVSLSEFYDITRPSETALRESVLQWEAKKVRLSQKGEQLLQSIYNTFFLEEIGWINELSEEEVQFLFDWQNVLEWIEAENKYPSIDYMIRTYPLKIGEAACKGYYAESL